jgi:hypothetical protein
MNLDLQMSSFVVEMERYYEMQRFDFRSKHGLLDVKTDHKGLRAWAAERLLGLALRLDGRLAAGDGSWVLGVGGTATPNLTPTGQR